MKHDHKDRCEGYSGEKSKADQVRKEELIRVGEVAVRTN